MDVGRHDDHEDTDAVDDDATDPVAESLSMSQVAEVTGWSKLTVYRLVHAGELPAVRVGRSVRVMRSALAPLLREPDRDDLA